MLKIFLAKEEGYDALPSFLSSNHHVISERMWYIMNIAKINEFKDIELVENISIPSKVHVYSLGVEYMREWFLKRFEDDFFKTIYVNGKHIFDDFRRFNREQITKVEKPALSIIPTVDHEFDRDTVDLRLGGLSVLTRRSRFKQQAIIQDPDHNLFLNMIMELVRMNFTFKVRVATRAQQDEISNYMKYAFRVGATQKEFVSYDYHLPYEAMLNIASRMGFELIYPQEEDKNKFSPRVKNIEGFLSYLNSYSLYPISYKMRTINGRSEFFMRLPAEQCCTHINNMDRLQLDEGEREEQLDNNFHIEMSPILSIPCPQQYFFYSEDALDERFKMKKEIAGLYSFRTLTPPEKDEQGWHRYLYTEYVEDEKVVDNIGIEELVEGSDLYRVIKHVLGIHISPSVFVNVKIFNRFKEKEISMDWENMNILLKEPEMKSDNSQIGIYVDLEFMNNQIKIMDQTDKSRMETKDQVDDILLCKEPTVLK